MEFKFGKFPKGTPFSGALKIIVMVFVVFLALWLVKVMFVNFSGSRWEKKTTKLSSEQQDLTLRKKWNISPEIFDNVQDDATLEFYSKKLVDSTEYKLCRELIMTPDAALDDSVTFDVKHSDLIAHPEKYRGKIISIVGRISQMPIKISLAEDNPIFLNTLYDLKIKDSAGNLHTLLSIQDIDTDKYKKGSLVQAVGAFYKILTINKKKQVSAPLTIIPHIRSFNHIKQNIADHVIVDILAPSLGLKIQRHFNYVFPPEKKEVELVEDPYIFENIIDNYFLSPNKTLPTKDSRGRRGALQTDKVIEAGMKIEAEPLYYLIKKCIVTPQEEISAEVDESVTYKKLMTDSEKYRGKAVRIQGKLIDIEMRQLRVDESNDTGMYSIPRGYISTKGKIVVFYCVDKK